MSFLDRLLGRSPYFPETEDIGPSRSQFLAKVAEVAGITDQRVTVILDERRFEVIGTLRGFPLSFAMDGEGGLTDLTLRHAGDFPPFELGYDREYAEHVFLKPVVLAPYVTISDRSLGDIAGSEPVFRDLPEALRAAIIATVPRLQIARFRSLGREEQLELEQDLGEVSDPVERLADALAFMVDTAIARGARVPPAGSTELWAAAEAMASRLHAEAPGAYIDASADAKRIDIFWRTKAMRVRIAVDAGTNTLEIRIAFVEVEEEGARPVWGTVQLLKTVPGTPAPRGDVFFGPGLATPATETAGIAILHALPPALLGELGKAMKPGTRVDVSGGRLEKTLANLPALTANGVLGWTYLLLRVAEALPRQPVAAIAPTGHCKVCGARFFAAPCPNCGG